MNPYVDLSRMLQRYSGDVLEKARSTVRKDQLEQDPEHPEVFFVLGSDGVTHYRVQIGGSVYDPAYLTCTCPHGLNQGAGDCRCYHTAAVLMWIEDNR